MKDCMYNLDDVYIYYHLLWPSLSKTKTCFEVRMPQRFIKTCHRKSPKSKYHLDQVSRQLRSHHFIVIDYLHCKSCTTFWDKTFYELFISSI